jgi:TolB-like protein
VLAVSGGVAWYRRPPDRARAAAAAPAVPGDATGTRRVLVAPFENATGDPALAPVGRMAAEWVAQGLAESGQLEVTAASGRPVAGGEAGLRAAAAENAATTVVSGAYYLEGDSVRLQARVTDARGWTLLSPVAPVRAPRSAPGGLLEPLRRSVAVVLAIARDDAFPGIAERGGAMPGGPVPDYDAYRQFAAGLEFFDRGDIGGALPHWARAAALDSTFASPVLISAQALLLRGRPAGADSLVRRLERRREALSAYERAILDRLRATLAGDRAGSLAGARAIRRAAPGWALGYFLQTFDAAQANRPREALAAAAHLAARGQHRRVAGPAGARDYWRGVVDAHHMLGDYAGELAAARAAGAEQTDGPDGAVHALRAFAALGRVAELGPRLDALEARPAAGALALELSALADELDAHGQPAAARGVRERVVALPRPEGPPAGTRAARAARGRALALLGRDADTAFARLAAEQPDEPAYLAERGVAAARRGARADAERYDARLRALARPYDWGQTPYARARLAAALGDRDGALALLREALARGLPFGPALHADPALAPLRGDARFQALMRPGG